MPRVLPERGQRGGRRSQHAEHIGLELPAVVVERQALEGAGHSEPGVRHHDVEAAERLERLTHGFLDRSVLPHVARDGERPAPRRSDLAGQVREPRETSRGQDEVGALAGELPGDGRPDAGRGAGDQSHAAGETVHAPVPQSRPACSRRTRRRSVAVPGPAGPRTRGRCGTNAASQGKAWARPGQRARGEGKVEEIVAIVTFRSAAPGVPGGGGRAPILSGPGPRCALTAWRRPP